ncbi:hypothetical protein [Actinobacillus indolicus]|nr:hypothetical protein [Actinobacillus indolicus]VFY95894.1 Uncharacterised protein [Actinobacillus indolicus]VTU09317.1 Uncharacterised protein [Actinobacillus indolicus]
MRKRKLKQRVRRLNSNKSRRILHIYRLKRRIAERRRIGFVILEQQC